MTSNADWGKGDGRLQPFPHLFQMMLFSIMQLSQFFWNDRFTLTSAGEKTNVSVLSIPIPTPSFPLFVGIELTGRTCGDLKD